MSSSHLSHHPQLKKHRLENGDYPYENGHLGEYNFLFFFNLCIGLYSNKPTSFSLTSWCDIKKVQISLIFDSILR